MRTRSRLALALSSCKEFRKFVNVRLPQSAALAFLKLSGMNAEDHDTGSHCAYQHQHAHQQSKVGSRIAEDISERAHRGATCAEQEIHAFTRGAGNAGKLYQDRSNDDINEQNGQ